MPSLASYGLPDFAEIELALGSQVPRRWGLEGKRGFSLAVEPASLSLWLLCPIEAYREPESVTRIIETKIVDIAGTAFLAIGTRQTSFLREIYYFLCGVVHGGENSSEDITSIIEGEIASWASILKTAQVLDVASQTGLLGELWVLWRTLCNRGSIAIDSWTGPLRELHDFHMLTEDLEVKTTLAHQRNHVVNSLDQITAKEGRPLFAVSIQLRPAGAGPGLSLPEAVDRIVERLSSDRSATEKFGRIMDDFGYDHRNAQLYTTHFGLRSLPAIIKVDNSFPRLTREALEKIMPPNVLPRLREVRYTVNLDGLGQDINDCGLSDLAAPLAGDLYE